MTALVVALIVAQSDTPSPSAQAISGVSKQNAIFMRPFINGESRVAIGGYLEMNVHNERNDGVDDGTSFEFQRFNLFVFSPISRIVRMLAEIEFEHGTEEINLETALVDVALAPELTLRGGIILTPIGAFNQAHDSPLWNFVDRPLVSTTIIPATFSEIGAGAHGTFLIGPVDLDYQVYATQGLAGGIVDNTLGRTSIPAGKSDELFGEDTNGSLALSGRLALRYEQLAELGFSAYAGAYNQPSIEGVIIDSRRDVLLAAVDYRVSTYWLEARGEAVYAHVDVPPGLAPQFGTRQWGAFVDLMSPVLRFPALYFDETRIEVGGRFEYLDYNAGRLTPSRRSAGDDRLRVTGCVAWRLSAATVVRANYVRDWSHDLQNASMSRIATAEIGFATYY